MTMNDDQLPEYLRRPDSRLQDAATGCFVVIWVAATIGLFIHDN